MQMIDFQLLSLITAGNNIFRQNQTHIVRKQEGNSWFGELFALIIQLLDCPIFVIFSQTPAYPNIWVNYNISLTWIKAICGSFPLLTMIIVRSQWGRYNLPRNMGRDTLTRYTLPLHYWIIYVTMQASGNRKKTNLTSRHWPSNYFGNVAQPLRNHPSIYHQPGSCCPIPLYSLVFL